MLNIFVHAGVHLGWEPGARWVLPGGEPSGPA
jgi:hypothetical protein